VRRRVRRFGRREDLFEHLHRALDAQEHLGQGNAALLQVRQCVFSGGQLSAQRGQAGDGEGAQRGAHRKRAAIWASPL